jgi:hypothetical protein
MLTNRAHFRGEHHAKKGCLDHRRFRGSRARPAAESLAELHPGMQIAQPGPEAAAAGLDGRTLTHHLQGDITGQGVDGLAVGERIRNR